MWIVDNLLFHLDFTPLVVAGSLFLELQVVEKTSQVFDILTLLVTGLGFALLVERAKRFDDGPGSCIIW